MLVMSTCLIVLDCCLIFRCFILFIKFFRILHSIIIKYIHQNCQISLGHWSFGPLVLVGVWVLVS